MKLRRIMSMALAAIVIGSALPSAAFADTAVWGNEKIRAEELVKKVSEESGIKIQLTGTTVTRADAAVAIAEAMGVSGTSDVNYKDIKDVSSEAASAIDVLSDSGILFGYPDGTFKPDKELTVSEGDVIAERIGDVLDTKYVDGIIQTTNFGSVIGYENEEDNAYVWKNIPYGKAPVGELRWKAPEYPDSWEGIIDATEKGNIGIQASGSEIKGSEDCLNLDIYRPNNDETNLPVLVYIHGGNNQTGESGQLDAAFLASKENCVVISTNFRLGALGFNCLPALKTGNPLEDSGNYTMLDIAKSLDWVKENAASFGGDGNNITVSGFSSGGRDVMAMLISPIFEDKFQKAISFSGGMTTTDPEEAVKVYANAFADLVVEDGVKATKQEAYNWLLTDGEDVKDYLYGLSAERIAKLMTGANIRMAPFPHLFEDGYVIPEGGFDANTYCNDVPLIMFTGSNEFSYYGLNNPAIKDRVSDGSVFTDAETIAERDFICKYGSALYGLFNAQESAERMFDYYDNDIYTCWIEWGNDPELVGEEMAVLWGSFHGINYSVMTGGRVLNAGSAYPEAFQSDGFLDLSYKFMDYMGNFMKTGNPNNGNPVEVEWQKWESASEGPTHLVFDADLDKAYIEMTDDRISYEEILKEIEADTTIPEDVKETIIKTNFNGRWFSSRLDDYFNNESLWIK